MLAIFLGTLLCLLTSALQDNSVLLYYFFTFKIISKQHCLKIRNFSQSIPCVEQSNIIFYLLTMIF